MGNKIYLADKETVDNVLEDTTSIENITTEIKNETADVLEDTAVIGDTNDIGASPTAGTVMGKLNKIITDISSHITNWTSTRAGYVDTIKTNSDNIKTYTTTNNTASKTGILSSKLSYIISLLENATYGLSALKTASSSGGESYAYIASSVIGAANDSSSSPLTITGKGRITFFMKSQYEHNTCGVKIDNASNFSNVYIHQSVTLFFNTKIQFYTYDDGYVYYVAQYN